MNERSNYSHGKQWWSISRMFLAATVGAALVGISIDVWSSPKCEDTPQAQASKVKQCEIDKEFRESVCLQNYYLCKLDSEECLNIFKSCRNSPIDTEKRA
jgi:hypothetical protein